MFIPLKDDNPRSRIGLQAVTIAFLAICVLVFLYQLTLSEIEQARLFYSYGLIPATLLGDAQLSPELERVPSWATLLTSMFLHGGFLHIAGNMLFLWVFGDNIEDALGHVRFIVFYVLCGLAAGLLHAAIDPSSEVPTIGASGAISGILGGYLVLYPRRGVWVQIFYLIVRRFPAWGVLGAWIGLQVINATIVNDPGANTAWWAHIGGFIAGAILVVPLRRAGVPLFEGRVPQTFKGPWSRDR
ncbi:MAG: rhomboid family intramembrane serine protease [Alphaproteobacteria bacterium]|nr:rhomboid family intramembrane serine protease [Alphaproteobacteria bacterium]